MIKKYPLDDFLSCNMFPNGLFYNQQRARNNQARQPQPKGDTMNEQIIETARRNFCAALRCGERNMDIREVFAELLERAVLRRDEATGKWECWSELGAWSANMARGLEARNHSRHCTALTTHDLRSFHCWDVTGLIDELRTA